MACASFAVGARHVYAFKIFFGVFQIIGEQVGRGQICFVRRLPHPLVHWQLGEKPRYGFWIVNGEKS